MRSASPRRRRLSPHDIGPSGFHKYLGIVTSRPLVQPPNKSLSAVVSQCTISASTLDVVDCILEAWLASRGLAIGPSSSASGMPCETREQRLARRQAQAEQRQRDQATRLSCALQRQIVDDDFSRYDRFTPAVSDTYVVQVSFRSAQLHNKQFPITPLTKDQPMTDATRSPPSSAASVSSTTPPETSFGSTPVHSITPIRTVIAPARERSGTIIARPRWDSTLAPPTWRVEASYVVFFKSSNDYAPDVLFSSTRGLDSSTALEFVQALCIATDIARITTAMSVYQASENVYDHFDKVCVMSLRRSNGLLRPSFARSPILHRHGLPTGQSPNHSRLPRRCN